MEEMRTIRIMMTSIKEIENLKEIQFIFYFILFGNKKTNPTYEFRIQTEQAFR